MSELPAVGAFSLRVLHSAPVRRIRAFHEERPKTAAAVFFFSGIGWDAATIYRIDSPVDNVLVILYLGLLGLVIATAALAGAGRLRRPFFVRLAPLCVPASQFLLGALFSVFVFFYSQSASWSETSVYLALLVGLLVANEFVGDRAFATALRITLYFVALATFLVYFLPIVTGNMSQRAFVGATLLALTGTSGLVAFLRRRSAFPGRAEFLLALLSPLLFFVLLQVAYVRNWIPPVPIAMREAGIYREVVREGNQFRMRYERPPWYLPFRRGERVVSYAPGDEVYCFTAVFAPTRLEKRVYHVWERLLDDETWETTDRIGYDIRGGRDHGYRGYTVKRHVQPGEWRVRVETGEGRLLSRITFRIDESRETSGDWVWRTVD